MRQPWLKFFASDWLGEAALRVCSLAARGLWIDVLMLMHQSPRRGYLLAPNGAPFGREQLARLVGASVDELVGLLDELRTAGVFSEDAGAIYSRRMVREAEKAALCSAAGKRGGGNPALGPAGARTPAGPPGASETFKGEDKGGPKGDPQPPLGPPSEPPAEEHTDAPATTAPPGVEVAEGAEDRAATTLTYKGGAKGGPKGRGKGDSQRPLTQKPEARVTSPSEKCGPDGTAAGEKAKAPTKAKAKPTDPNHAPAVRAFCDAWAAKYGAKYPFDRGKDAVIVATVLDAVGRDLARFHALVDRYLADSFPFAADNRHDLGTLKLKLPRWLVAPATAPPPASSAPVEFSTQPPMEGP